MTRSQRLLCLILSLILGFISMAATGTGIVLLYEASFEQTQTRLTETAHSQALLIDAVARFDKLFSQTDDPEGALGATLSQVKDAHSHSVGLGKTGEILLVRSDGDEIVFVLNRRHGPQNDPGTISPDSEFAAPMQLALAGQSGNIVGMDYRGEPVLAAFEPIPSLGMGIVAKIDIAELRAPFLRAGLIATLIALLLVAIGILLFLRIGGSMSRLITDNDTRFKTLLGSSPVCIHELGLKGHLLSLNQAGLKMMGIKEEKDSIGIDYLAIPIASDQERIRTLFERACEGMSSEFLFSVNAGNELRHVSGSFTPIRERDGKITRVMGICQDITKEKATESALIRSESRYQDLYDKAEVAIFEEDSSQLWARFEELRNDGVSDLRTHLDTGQISAASLTGLIRVKDANQSALDLFGASSKEQLLASVERVFARPAMNVMKEELLSMWRRDESFRAEAELHTLSGEFLQVIISIPLPQTAEAALSVPVTIIDITKQREIEESLRRSQKLEAIGQLAGGIAHDFNNLMAIMIGHSEILGTIVGSNAKAQQSIRALTQSVERGASLTKRLLTFSRQEPFKPSVADLGSAVKALRNMLTRTLGETIALSIEADPETWRAKVDVHQLEHAIINLALNSLDAMPAGGSLSIQASNRAIHHTATGKFRDVPPGDYVQIEVRDTGSGISPKNLERVFDPFFTTKEFGQGTGLGLSTVYGFVKQSKGHIFVESKPEKGTSMLLLVPRHLGHQVLETPAASTNKALLGGNEKVLLVEDDEGVRKIAANTLTTKGYDVTEAGCGKEAVKHLSGPEEFDLLFTDVVLPGGIDGREVAKEAMHLQPKIVVLYTSGYVKDATLTGAKMDNRSRILTKPYRSKDLLTAAREALDSHSSQ